MKQEQLQEILQKYNLTEAQFARIQKAIEIAADLAAELIVKIVAEITKALQKICEAIFPILAKATEVALKSAYPNRRVVWLAFHHKRERTRKKNRKRIMRYLLREGRCL